MSLKTEIEDIADAYAGIIYDGHYNLLPRVEAAPKIKLLVKEACDQATKRTFEAYQNQCKIAREWMEKFEAVNKQQT